MGSLVGSAIADRPIRPPSDVLFPHVLRPAIRPERIGNAGLQRLLPLVVVDIASDTVFVAHQQPSTPLPSASTSAPRTTIPAPCILAALVNGLNVLMNQPVAASDEPPELFASLSIVKAAYIVLELIEHVGDFLVGGLECEQPFGGPLHQRQQHGPGCRCVGGRDRGEVAPAEPVLVALPQIGVNLASELLKGVLELRLDGVAGEEHFGDGCHIGSEQWLMSHQTNNHEFMHRLDALVGTDAVCDRCPLFTKKTASAERALQNFYESSRVIRVIGEP